MTAARTALILVVAIAGGCGAPPSGSGDASPGAPDARSEDAAPGDGPSSDAGPADAQTLLADLIVNRARVETDLAIHTRAFGVGSCELELDEACVGGPGTRRLLRFSVETANLGTADLVVGAPSPSNPNFVYSSCHDHYHFTDYADYQLLDGNGAAVAPGHKQAFCLLDSEPYLGSDPTIATERTYHCGWQGLQRGWADVYQSRLPCQWVDITETPPGAYTLRITVNAHGTLAEQSLANNVIEVPVVLGDAALETPTETCALAPLRDLDNLSRECGWDDAGFLPCTPGQLVDIGCSACGALGSCTGNPMMRVCDGAEPNCSFGAAVALSDDECSPCPRVQGLMCPPGGRLAVFTAAKVPGQAYSCVPVLAAQ